MDMTILIAAASAAAGPAPGNTTSTPAGPAPDPTSYQKWKGRVLAISSDLASMVNGYEAREARKTGSGVEGTVTAFHARLVSVKAITKGTGENTVRKGQLTLEAFNSSNADAQGHETIETAPLGSPEGDEEYMRAQALVGQNVKVYKRNFLHPADKSKKLKELVAIDAASGFSSAPSPAPGTPAPPPAPERPTDSESIDSERLLTIREQLNALEGNEKNKFREFMQMESRSAKSADWDDDALDLIEGWLFGGSDASE